MTKITLNHVGNLIDTTTAQSTINADLDTIQTAFDNTLSRDGTAPNTMQSNLDMNSNQILNLPVPATVSSPLRLADLTSFVGGGTVTNIPAGGTTGQALKKTSNTDYAVGWNNDVSSVGLSLPADFTVTNSPVTSSGTLTATYATTPTGTGAFVRATSPSLVTPNIGSATAATVNKISLTAPATSATLTVPDGTTQTFPSSSGTVVSSASTNVVTNTMLSQAAAFTFKGNSTGSTATVTDVSLAGLTNKASPVGSDMILIADSAASNALKQITVSSLASGGAATPTTQVFTSGSGTYTKPANVTWIEVEMVGGGGGGAGSGTTPGSGGTGGNTTFGSSLLTANGGNGAVASAGAGGGTASTGAAIIIISRQGGSGQNGSGLVSTAGGNGGISLYGATGWGGAPGAGAGVAAFTNSGSGGGGGGVNATVNGGGGGGAGGFVRAIITAPAATYAYAVGAAGTAGTTGTGGAAGGAGGSGYIVVKEYYAS
jgi:hypothetical protein